MSINWIAKIACSQTNGNQTWMDRVNGFLKATDVFFVKTGNTNQPPANPQGGGQIMSEVACEWPEPQTCNYDQPSFKAYLSRWLAVTTQLVPSTAATIMPRLAASAQAAAVQCSGPGNQCGRRWYQTVWDGQKGVGEQMSALSIFQNNLIANGAAPQTLDHGGTSKSDPNAGDAGGGNLPLDPLLANPPTTADKAGAGILTFLSLVLVIAITAWIII